MTQSVPTNGSLNDTFLLRVSKNAFIGNYSDTVKFYSGNMLIKYIIIAYNVLKLPTQPSIIQSADNLISSQSVFYKWHLNNIILQDSTPVIKISSIGIYRVETSDDNFCWNFSNDYIIQTSPSSLEQNDYDLSIQKYKEIEYEEIKYEEPKVIKKKILELEEEIIKTLKELEI